jgi:hypothetical protein
VEALIASAVRAAGCELAPDAATSALEVAHARLAVDQRPHKPAPEIGVGGGWIATGLRVGAHGPQAARPATALTLALSPQQPRVEQALEMDAHAVWVEVDPLGELVRAHRTPQMGQQGEQAGARWLREHIAGLLGTSIARKLLTGMLGEAKVAPPLGSVPTICSKLAAPDELGPPPSSSTFAIEARPDQWRSVRA